MSEHSSSRALDSDEAPRFVAKLRSGKPILFRPRGHSMSPSLTDGTVVMVDPVTRVPRTYEIVLALLDGHVVMHRVMHLDGDRVWLMGDAHRHSEGPLPLARIIGLARLLPPKGVRALVCRVRRAFFLLSHLGRL